MNAAGDDAADDRDAGSDPPPTVELLADLQAGILDDEAAAHIRGRIHTDPHAAAVLGASMGPPRRRRRRRRTRFADPPGGDRPISAALRSAEPAAADAARGPARRCRSPPARRLRPARIISSRGPVRRASANGFGTVALLRASRTRPDTPGDVSIAKMSTPPMEIRFAQRDPRPARPAAPTQERSATGSTHLPHRPRLSGVHAGPGCARCGSTPPGVVLVIPRRQPTHPRRVPCQLPAPRFPDYWPSPGPRP